ncbi:hypothetical protein J6590_030716 [Homalodisca vitripennis]|nr:hypothetical protein J6590_030716 [Homalodisca vitripennis]
MPVSCDPESWSKAHVTVQRDTRDCNALMFTPFRMGPSHSNQTFISMDERAPGKDSFRTSGELNICLDNRSGVGGGTGRESISVHSIPKVRHILSSHHLVLSRFALTDKPPESVVFVTGKCVVSRQLCIVNLPVVLYSPSLSPS